MRALLRRLHRWCGLSVAIVLLASSLSGSLIAFEHELDSWLNPELFYTETARAALPLDALIAKIEEQDPRLRVTQMPLDTQPGQAREVHVEPKTITGPHRASIGFDRLFVDPTTGRMLGSRQWGVWQWDRAHLMPWMNRFHRSLTLPGRIGNQLLGSVAVVWLFISLAGLYLTLPAKLKTSKASELGTRQPKVTTYWSRWKPAWKIKGGTKGFRKINDLHRATGLWVLPLTLSTAFTGIYLNLGNELFKPVVSLFGPITPHPFTTIPKASTPLAKSPVLSPEQALDRARALLPDEARDYENWYLGYDASRGLYRAAFKENGLREHVFRVRYEQIFVDDESGNLLSRFGYISGSTSDRFLVWLYPVHSGKLLGVPGRLAISLGGLFVALICATGVLRWAKRTSAKA
ncbi:PepSY-associated TM helix domain-containing protein [Ottowia thiooxydans]|uniref:Iron-regulated membrane protein n=1 Tax=Ottowia thiooxydans TaxID=219182 RepID=A0ABV2Q704_9BURK